MASSLFLILSGFWDLLYKVRMVRNQAAAFVTSLETTMHYLRPVFPNVLFNFVSFVNSYSFD